MIQFIVLTGQKHEPLIIRVSAILIVTAPDSLRGWAKSRIIVGASAGDDLDVFARERPAAILALLAQAALL